MLSAIALEGIDYCSTLFTERICSNHLTRDSFKAKEPIAFNGTLDRWAEDNSSRVMRSCVLGEFYDLECTLVVATQAN